VEQEQEYEHEYEYEQEQEAYVTQTQWQWPFRLPFLSLKDLRRATKNKKGKEIDKIWEARFTPPAPCSCPASRKKG
jgi:hypothetical protein